jgi:hypothetical protein
MATRTVAHGSEILLELPGDGSVEKVIDLVRAEGGRIVSVLPKRESLESLFLREVGQSSGEAPRGQGGTP